MRAAPTPSTIQLASWAGSPAALAGRTAVLLLPRPDVTVRNRLVERGCRSRSPRRPAPRPARSATRPCAACVPFAAAGTECGYRATGRSPRAWVPARIQPYRLRARRAWPPGPATWPRPLLTPTLQCRMRQRGSCDCAHDRVPVQGRSARGAWLMILSGVVSCGGLGRATIAPPAPQSLDAGEDGRDGNPGSAEAASPTQPIADGGERGNGSMAAWR